MVVPSLEDSQDIIRDTLNLSPPAAVRPPGVVFVGPERGFGVVEGGIPCHNQQRTYFLNDQLKPCKNTINQHNYTYPAGQNYDNSLVFNQSPLSTQSSFEGNSLAQFGAENSWLEESCEVRRSNSFFDSLLSESQCEQWESGLVAPHFMQQVQSDHVKEVPNVNNPEDILNEIVREAKQYETVQQDVNVSNEYWKEEVFNPMSNTSSDGTRPNSHESLYGGYDTEGLHIQKTSPAPVVYQLQGLSEEGVVLQCIPVKVMAKHTLPGKGYVKKFKGKQAAYIPESSRHKASKLDKKSYKISVKHEIKDSKEKKRAQNRAAALRYRLKKREAKNEIGGELEIEEKRNMDLVGKVHAIKQEIKYLKSLMSEMKKACA